MVEALARAAGEAYVRALKTLPRDVKDALRNARGRERNARAQSILDTICRNVEVAEETGNIICQDTGTPVYYLSLGEAFPLPPRRIEEAVRLGCADVTARYAIRPNAVHPFRRVNTGNNVGRGVPVIHFAFTAGDALELLVVPKGSGSENQSFLKMLVPAEGRAGIERFVLECVTRAGGMPCPPVVLGVGVGGTFDQCAGLAKRAASRPIGSACGDPDGRALEQKLLQAVNALGIGPMGLGGDTTALAVHVETADTHISQLPVAVNTQCWAARRAAVRVDRDGQATILS
ncbi:MAG: fumarate hydratase [Lentisphaerae bacterium]|nr:fumarate hydratase [Lentisphaerota bacterium]